MLIYSTNETTQLDQIQLGQSELINWIQLGQLQTKSLLLDVTPGWSAFTNNSWFDCCISDAGAIKSIVVLYYDALVFIDYDYNNDTSHYYQQVLSECISLLPGKQERWIISFIDWMVSGFPTGLIFGYW